MSFKEQKVPWKLKRQTAGQAVPCSYGVLRITTVSSKRNLFFIASCTELPNKWLCSLLVLSRHGPRRKIPFPNGNSIGRAYWLPRERVYLAVAQKRSLFTELRLSNWSIRHNIFFPQVWERKFHAHRTRRETLKSCIFSFLNMERGAKRFRTALQQAVTGI
jgi:hypothetical protein